jgi:hypothetical protein
MFSAQIEQYMLVQLCQISVLNVQCWLRNSVRAVHSTTLL